MQDCPAFGWLDGAVVPWRDCTVHARSQGGLWGSNVFEGIRAYRKEGGGELLFFRFADHLQRFRRSMKCVRMELPYPDEQILAGCRDLLAANGFHADAHIVITGYFGIGQDLDPLNLTGEAGLHITAVETHRRPAQAEGISVCVSSWRRISDDTMPPRIKTGANYHNNRLAHQEAVRNGYHTALLLNGRGQLAEAPGACLVMVRDGQLLTPPGTSGVLEGITVATIAELATQQLGLHLTHRELDRTELYVADEAFLCGTMQEVLPVTSVDGLPIGDGRPGATTRRLQQLYDHAVRTDGVWTTPAFATPGHRPEVSSLTRTGG